MQKKAPSANSGEQLSLFVEKTSEQVAPGESVEKVSACKVPRKRQKEPPNKTASRLKKWERILKVVELVTSVVYKIHSFLNCLLFLFYGDSFRLPGTSVNRG